MLYEQLLINRSCIYKNKFTNTASIKIIKRYCLKYECWFQSIKTQIITLIIIALIAVIISPFIPHNLGSLDYPVHLDLNFSSGSIQISSGPSQDQSPGNCDGVYDLRQT